MKEAREELGKGANIVDECAHAGCEAVRVGHETVAAVPTARHPAVIDSQVVIALRIDKVFSCFLSIHV